MISKLFFVLISVCLFFSFGGVGTAHNHLDRDKLPENWGETDPGNAGTITFNFDSGRSVTVNVDGSKRYTNDERIEQELISLRAGDNIHKITHVNGEPIESTKWAKYAGLINPLKKDKDNLYERDFITVIVNNHPVKFSDVEPFIKDGRTLVPIRAVYEHYNVQAEVSWDGHTKTVTAVNRQGVKVVFQINNKEYKVTDVNGNQKVVTNDVAPTIHEGRTMLPLRALGESLGLQVNWIKESKVVDIKANNQYTQHLMTRKEWEAYLKGEVSK